MQTVPGDPIYYGQYDFINVTLKTTNNEDCPLQKIHIDVGSEEGGVSTQVRTQSMQHGKDSINDTTSAHYEKGLIGEHWT